MNPAPATELTARDELLENLRDWTRQVAAREDIPRGVRSAAANLHADCKRIIESEVRALAAAPTEPIDMVLHCPNCGMQHVDHAEPAVEHEHGTVEFEAWDNPPHKSHLCHGCGHIWRPADVPTNGVAAVKTIGTADSPVAAAPATLTPAVELDKSYVITGGHVVHPVAPSITSLPLSPTAERAAFEEYGRNGGLNLGTLDHLEAYPWGTYADSRVDAAWKGWQARALVHSRVPLVESLPVAAAALLRLKEAMALLMQADPSDEVGAAFAELSTKYPGAWENLRAALAESLPVAGSVREGSVPADSVHSVGE